MVIPECAPIDWVGDFPIRDRKTNSLGSSYGYHCASQKCIPPLQQRSGKCRGPSCLAGLVLVCMRSMSNIQIETWSFCKFDFQVPVGSTSSVHGRWVYRKYRSHLIHLNRRLKLSRILICHSVGSAASQIDELCQFHISTRRNETEHLHAFASLTAYSYLRTTHSSDLMGLTFHGKLHWRSRRIQGGYWGHSCRLNRHAVPFGSGCSLHRFLDWHIKGG